VTLLRSSVSNNSAVSVGGMLLSGRGGSSLTLDSSVVSDNRAYYGAGGLQLQSSTVNIVNSTISDNTASYYGYGGGLAIFTSLPISITNSTISGNSVGGRGGGMYLYTGRGGETVNINNTTISNNSSREDGGGIAIIYAQVSLSNSIVSGNRDTDLDGSEIFESNFYLDYSSNISFFGTNVLGDSANTYRNAFSLSNGGIPEDTQIIATEDGNTPTPISNILAPLADNGGPTQTHALVDGSPAIDAGDNITCEDSDQRFEIRPDGPSCDIGAFEGGSPNSEPESEPATFVIPLPNGRVVVFDL